MLPSWFFKISIRVFTFKPMSSDLSILLDLSSKGLSTRVLMNWTTVSFNLLSWHSSSFIRKSNLFLYLYWAEWSSKASNTISYAVELLQHNFSSSTIDISVKIIFDSTILSAINPTVTLSYIKSWIPTWLSAINNKHLKTSSCLWKLCVLLTISCAIIIIFTNFSLPEFSTNFSIAFFDALSNHR